MQYSTPTLDEILRELQDKLDKNTTDIDKNNSAKDYLNNRIKELTAKKTEIDKFVGDYEKEYNNTMEKNAELKGYVERKKPPKEEVGEHRIEEIEKIIEDESKGKDGKEGVEETKTKLDNLIKGLPEAKKKLWDAQNNLTIKQKSYEDLKTRLKDRQKEFPIQSKKLDNLKKSVDDYFNDREHKLAELYFSIKESESFSEDLHDDFKEPDDIRCDLERDCRAVIDAMGIVSNAEASLKTTQSDIDACKKNLIWLETKRLTNILDRIAKLGTCIEGTAESPAPSENYEE